MTCDKRLLNVLLTTTLVSPRSFQRQLYIYGFRRIRCRGMLDTGAYYHEQFLREDKDLCLQMKRQKIKGNTENNCNLDYLVDPNFYTEAEVSNNARSCSNPTLFSPRPITPSSNIELLTLANNYLQSPRLCSWNQQYQSEIRGQELSSASKRLFSIWLWPQRTTFSKQ